MIPMPHDETPARDADSLESRDVETSDEDTPDGLPVRTRVLWGIGVAIGLWFIGSGVIGILTD